MNNFRAVAGALCVLLFCSAPIIAADNIKSDKDWTLNLKDVDINVFLEQVSSITGANFVVDPQAHGKVSVVATTPMSREAVNELLLTVLRVNNLTAVPSGSTTRIVPQANVKVGSDSETGSGQEIVTRVIPVKNAEIEEVVKLLKPLLSPSGYIEGSEYSNSIIISDYADSVAQIVRAMRKLDQQDDANVEVIPMKEAWVGNIVPLIEAVAPMQLSKGEKSHNRLRVVADERSNSIIVRGNPADRAAIRKLVLTFDRKTPNASNIQMIHLQYADAKDVAAILRGSIPMEDKNKAQAQNTGTGMLSQTSLQGHGSSSSSGNAANTQGDIASTNSFIQADTTLNTLIIRAEPEVMSEIRSLVRQLDTRRPQVLIEAAIVEISVDKTQQLGVQFSGGKASQTINTGLTQFSGTGTALGTMLAQLGSMQAGVVANEGLSVALGSNGQFNMLVQALAGTSGANLLSTPSIITLDNQEAKIVVGQNVPFRTGSYSTSTQTAGTTTPFTTIEREDIGITLKVTPQIHEGNIVSLDISQEASSIAPANQQTAGAADIITNKRTIDTKVLAENGETVVLGGLMQDNVTGLDSKVPLLGDIPYLGALFKYQSHEHSKSNLLIFLRPTVMRGREEMARITQARYNGIYELQFGTKDLLDDMNQSSFAPTADTIFNPPLKTLPWLVGNGKSGSLPAPSSNDLAPAPLPWLKEDRTVNAVPVAPVTVIDNPSPAQLRK